MIGGATQAPKQPTGGALLSSSSVRVQKHNVKPPPAPQQLEVSPEKTGERAVFVDIQLLQNGMFQKMRCGVFDGVAGGFDGGKGSSRGQELYTLVLTLEEAAVQIEKEFETIRPFLSHPDILQVSSTHMSPISKS